MNPHLIVFHSESVPSEYFDDFVVAVRSERLECHVQARPDEPFATLEWLMPTVIVAYVAKPYFESFLKEMGKDHYAVLKDAFKRLYSRVAGPKSPEVSLVSAGGKASSEQPYSLFFSIVAEGPHDVRFKLLIPRPIEEVEYAAAIDAFLKFADRVHSGKLDEEPAAAELSTPPQVGRTALVVYDVDAKCIRAVDPLAGRRT